MGMFDYLRCEYTLPAPNCEGIEFQTSDTPSQYLDKYTIKADGSLWVEEYDTEDRSDPNATGLMRLRGSQARVNHRLVACPDFTGEIAFGTIGPEIPPWHLAFSSYFRKGMLQQVHLLEDTRPVADAEGAAP